MTPPPAVPRRAKAGVAALLAAVAGCAVDGETQPRLVEVSPRQAYNDSPVSIVIRGGPFRPSYAIDTQSGQATLRQEGYSALLSRAEPSAGPEETFQASDIAWQSSATLVADLPEGLPAGEYDVVVGDPRGGTATLARGFVSLGPDTSPPIVTLESPAEGDLLGAGSTVEVNLRAGDGHGLLAAIEWEVSSGTAPLAAGTCTVPAGARATTCGFSFVAPTPKGTTDTLTITARATDRGGRSGTDRDSHLLARAPGVDDASPLKGSTAGGTEVRILGSNFHPPTGAGRGTELVFGTVPAHVSRVEPDGTLVGVSPPGGPGPVRLFVRNGGAATRSDYSFEYVAPAAVRSVFPPEGPPEGGTSVAVAGNDFRPGETVVRFGSQPLLCPRYVSPQRIDGIVPPGVGTVFVTASNPIGGSSPLSATYRYTPENGDAGTPAVQCPR